VNSPYSVLQVIVEASEVSRERDAEILELVEEEGEK